jgi:hydroxymethylpyrimidine/phosphomethylpyrimidine kinase
LAKGLDLPDAIRNSKEYLVGALKYNLNIGKGNGPLNHCYKIMEG